MATEKRFTSILSPYIEAHIKEKRGLGFVYEKDELILLRFDRYCTERGLSTLNLSKSFLDDWCEKLDTEGISGQKSRVETVRQLLLYMVSLGIEEYLPKFTGRRETTVPHIFSEEEMRAFFHEVDSYEPEENRQTYNRLANEYRVLFRILYCCGLRNSECCQISSNMVDLKSGILTILNSKGHKDRLVYMAEDLTMLCGEYYEYLCEDLHMSPQWFFPSSNPQKPLSNTSIGRVFSTLWNRTPYAATCNIKPTVHDLRFTFITDRIDDWSAKDVNVDVMMPYFGKYVGHKNVQDTYYYYHNTKQLYRSIQEKDKTSELYIPEAKNHE